MQKYVIFLGLVLSCQALATVPVDPLVSVCSPYPSIKSSGPIPSEFNGTNNLARSSESAFYQAEGEKIVIYGRLMDANCVPINDAKIYIWQNNLKGYVQYPNSSANKAKWIDPNFTGTGMANSDNLGRFNFITIMPGSTGKITPHINIKIDHPVLKTFVSKIYFTQDNSKYINDSLAIQGQAKVAKVSAVPGKLEVSGRPVEYFIDITLNQAVPNKEY